MKKSISLLQILGMVLAVAVLIVMAIGGAAWIRYLLMGGVLLTAALHRARTNERPFYLSRKELIGIIITLLILVAGISYVFLTRH